MPSTCCPSNNINNVPRGIALRLKRICDSDEKFTVRSNEYKNYLIARDYKPKVVEKHFSEISKLRRAEARQINLNNRLMTEFCLQQHIILCCQI